MQEILQYQIPYLHPLAVHFPLTLLIMVGITGALWGLRDSAFFLKTGVFLSGFGFSGALFAYLTGEAFEESMEGDPMVEQFAALHEKFGLYTTIVAGILFTGFACCYYRYYRPNHPSQTSHVPKGARLALVVLCMLAAILVAITGHFGGTMVWGVAG